ncbi:MAG TPA: hypothetical protein VGP63_22090, partial [Planctomycetaceae bacterium]|nr:hypothetical protein [Planctomycetaceae bacterium]
IDCDPPKVIGVRKNSRGQTVQEFVYQQNCLMSLPLPGPHGPAAMPIRDWHYCYIREPGKWRRELVFLRNIEVNSLECAPVANTNFWVMECFGTSRGDHPRKLEVLTLDETRILRRHELGGDLNWERGPYPLTKFENGNRLLVYRSIRGLESYDVVTGAIAPWTKRWDTSESVSPVSK